MAAPPVVLVTGASRGLGRALVRSLVDRKARVVAVVRKQADAASLEAEYGGSGGGAVVTVLGDVTDPEVPARAVGAAVASFGRLDALINNAGILEPLKRVVDVTPEEWTRMMAVNVVAPATFVRAALPELRKTEGVVVNISSGAAVNVYEAWAPYSAYVAGRTGGSTLSGPALRPPPRPPLAGRTRAPHRSKAALNQFNAVLGKEEPTIRTVAVRPGLVATDMQGVLREQGKTSMAPDQHARFLEAHRENKLLPPEVPANAIAKLALACPRKLSGTYISWEEIDQLLTA